MPKLLETLTALCESTFSKPNANLPPSLFVAGGLYSRISPVALLINAELKYCNKKKTSSATKFSQGINGQYNVQTGRR